MEKIRRLDIGPVLMALALLNFGCSAHPEAMLGIGKMPVQGSAEELAGQLMSPEDRKRLADVARRRAGTDHVADYTIGPEDQLNFKIPDLRGSQSFESVGTAAEYTDRVSNDGTVDLPTLGTVRVAGLTANQVEDAVARQLVAKGILKTPEVEVTVTEYRSGVVNVIGSVVKAGPYPITKAAATILDMVLLAGGPEGGAGRIVQFSPADALAEPVKMAAAAVPSATTTDAPPAAPAQAAPRGRPIRIDLEVLLRSGPTDPSLNPPVMAGDVIRLAPAGSVQVEGWVDKPGSFPVTSTTTVSSVLASAVDLFAADVSEVTIRRTLAPGEQTTFVVDVGAVAEGKAPDFPLTDGDVVTVPAHAGRLIPYSLYSVGKEMINVGGNIPLF